MQFARRNIEKLSRYNFWFKLLHGILISRNSNKTKQHCSKINNGAQQINVWLCDKSMHSNENYLHIYSHSSYDDRIVKSEIVLA